MPFYSRKNYGRELGCGDEDFMEVISDYVDFSENEELWKESPHMTGLGQSIYEEGIEQGIKALVIDHIEEKKAEEYYERFASQSE